MKRSSPPSQKNDLIEELDSLGYRQLAEIFQRLFPEHDPYEIIKTVLDSLDEQRRLIKQA